MIYAFQTNKKNFYKRIHNKTMFIIHLNDKYLDKWNKFTTVSLLEKCENMLCVSLLNQVFVFTISILSFWYAILLSHA